LVFLRESQESLDLMSRFLNKKISENELLDLTRPDSVYEAIYLCSALVLEVYRVQGIAKRLSLQAVESICKKHPVQSLFVWPFSNAGDTLSDKITSLSKMPMLKRTNL
jgi:hypothetical protein